MLTIESVTKRYRSGVVAVNSLSLTLGPGIVGLLGPNGAGKSTLMHMIVTLTRPTSGRILFQGIDIHRQPDAVRSHLGYLPQDFGVYENITAFEFVSYLAGLKGVHSRTTIMNVLESVNLHASAHRLVKTFSGGMRQRLGIAQALVNEPQLLIVDEPTSGLDPEERIRFRMLISSLAQTSLVILSTHIVSDVEAIAGTIALLNKGELLASGSPESIIGTAAGNVWEAVIPSGEFGNRKKPLRISSAVQKPDGMHVRFVGPGDLLPGAHPVEPGLEDAFLFLLDGAQPS